MEAYQPATSNGNPLADSASNTEAAAIVNSAQRESGLDEATLVTQARRGDAAAVAMLIERYQDRVYNACWRMSRDQAEASDLTQSVFEKVLQNLPRFEARSSFYTWLFRITVNVVLSERRKRRVREAESLEALRDSAAERFSRSAERERDPAQVLERAELHERLEHALARLDDEFRVALLLRDVEGMDYAAIAEVLEVPVGTVKSRIHRGRQALREALSKEEENRDSAAV